jgi:hypothetical protein
VPINRIGGFRARIDIRTRPHVFFHRSLENDRILDSQRAENDAFRPVWAKRPAACAETFTSCILYNLLAYWN